MKNKTETPSYYAIIPSCVRYDDCLKPNAKLLYGEITALCNKEGYCWASNDYFARLYSVSKETISRWVSQLHKSGHIIVEIKNKNTADRSRTIQIPIDKKIKGGMTKRSRGIDKKVKYNTTSNNTVNIKDIEDILTCLNLIAHKNFRTKNTKNVELISARLKDGYCVTDCKRVIYAKSNEWLGTDMEKYLKPSTLFRKSKFDDYYELLPPLTQQPNQEEENGQEMEQF